MSLIALAMAASLAAGPQDAVILYDPAIHIPQLSQVTSDPTCRDTPDLAATSYCGLLRYADLDAVMQGYAASFETQGLVEDNLNGNVIFRRPATPTTCSYVLVRMAMRNGVAPTPDAQVLVMIRLAPRCEPIPVVSADRMARNGGPLIGIPRLEGVQRDLTCGGLAADQIGPTEYCATVSRDRADEVFAAYSASLEDQNLAVREQDGALVFSQHQDGGACDAMRLYRRAPVAETVTIVIEGLGGSACATNP